MNKLKMIVLNLVLLAGIMTSVSTAVAGIQNNQDTDGADLNQSDAGGAQQGGDTLGGSSSDGNDNCTYTPVGGGCAVCAGCSSPCGLI